MNGKDFVPLGLMWVLSESVAFNNNIIILNKIYIAPYKIFKKIALRFVVGLSFL